MVQNLMIQIQSKYKFIIVHAPSVVLASLPSYGLYYLLLLDMFSRMIAF